MGEREGGYNERRFLMGVGRIEEKKTETFETGGAGGDRISVKQ